MPSKNLLQAAGDGTAIPAGYVGQVLHSAVTTATNTGSTGIYFDATSVTITPGTWLINADIIYRRNGATITDSSAVIGLTTTSGNSSSGQLQPVNWIDTGNGTNSATFSSLPIKLPTVYCRYDGTTVTLSNGSTLATASGTLYLKGYTLSFSAGNPQYICSLTAVRIA